MDRKTREQYLKEDAKRMKMKIVVWRPGDGQTRYQFVRANQKDTPVLVGIREAELYLWAYGDGLYDGEQWAKNNQNKKEG